MDLDPHISEGHRIRVSKRLVNLFKHWQLSLEEQLGILGIQNTNPYPIICYLEGARLSNDEDLFKRVRILLNMHKSLRLLFPNDRNLAYAWMTTPNRSFNGLTPTEVVMEQGNMGVSMVQSYLDYHLNGLQAVLERHSD